MPWPGAASQLWGRDEQRHVLREVLGRVERGAMATVVIEGEAGIGKSALLAAVLDEADNRGFGVWSGQAQELERARPFGLWSAALRCSASSDPARSRIARLLTPPRAVPTVSSDPGLRFQVVDAFVDLVEDLAHERPVVVGLDDLQWADPSSLLTLTALARRLSHAPVLTVLCSRPPISGGDLARALSVIRGPGVIDMPLGPLTEHQVERLVADVLGAVPAPDLLARIRGAGGNPLYVTEFLAALRREEIVQTVRGRAELLSDAMPPSLGLTIVRHLSLLSEHALEVLRPASVLGVGFAVSQLSTATGRPVAELASGLSEALAAGVLGEDGDRLRFRHELIRDAVYDDLPRSLRQAMHQEVGLRLAAAGVSALTVAEHLLRGPTVDDVAIRWLREAARDCAPGSPATAAALLDRGVRALEPGSPRQLELQGERAADLLWAGRTRDAEQLFREVLDRGLGAVTDRTLRMGLARALIVEGRVAEGVEEFGRVEGSLPNSSEGAEVRAWLSMARATSGDLDGATAAATTVLSSSGGTEDPFAATMALGALALTAEMRGQLHNALELIDRAVSRVDDGAATARRYPAQVTRAHILVELDRAEEAGAALAEQIGEAGTAGSTVAGRGDEQPWWHAARIIAGYAGFVTGDWDEAVTALETGLSLVEETGQASSAVFGRSVLSMIALHRGRWAEAQRAADQARRQRETGGPSFRSEWAAWANAGVAEAAGDGQQAFAVLAESWDRCAQHGSRVEHAVLGPDLMRLAIAGGDRSRAGEVAEALDELAATHAVPAFAAAALRCRGRFDGDPEPLLAAVEASARSRRPLALALAAEDAAEVLAARGADGDARVLLERAAGVFEQLDASRDLARIEARFRAAGVRRGRRGPRSRPRSGWESLTPTEQKVVELVAEGLSNPQIGSRLYLSRRTVQTHLTHVFAKLGLTSRAHLAAEAARRPYPIDSSGGRTPSHRPR